MAIHLPIILFVLLAIDFRGSSGQASKKELITEMLSKEQTMLSVRIDPSKVTQLSWQPRVFLYRGFLTEEECDYLISQVNGNKSDVLRNRSLAGIQMIGGLSIAEKDEAAKRIEEKISAWTFLPKGSSKPLRVLHFGPEDSGRHYTYLDRFLTEDVSEPLVATVILYLSNASKGGNIIFPTSKNKLWSDCKKIRNTVRPTKGNAILFFNLHLNATPDESSIHARCPLPEDELWIATKLLYLDSVIREKEILQSDSADCTDEDENCPRWAAVGECQRNYVFMIGSPDYYGTCRKSCNAC